MHVFVTGASGWVGSAVVAELLAAGHAVSGLVRSDEKGATLRAQGATPLRGSLDDLQTLRQAAASADAVVHTAFNHDFSRFAENCEQDRRAIMALGAALEGSQRPLLVTSGLAGVAPGRLATEADGPPAEDLYPRRSEAAAAALAARGLRVATVRLAASVHGRGDQAFVPLLIGMAREAGVSAYAGDGLNRWPAVHRRDAARVYRLALEAGLEQPVYHAVAEEGLAFRKIAGVIGERLGLPVVSRAPEHFGWFATFAAADMAASAARTRQALGWEPREPGLLEELATDAYFAPAPA